VRRSVTLAPKQGAPAVLAERGAIDVGVEGDGDGERAEGADDVRAGPARLGRRGDEAECRRATVEIDRAEAGDADRGDALGVRAEEVGHAPERLGRRGGGDARLGADVRGAGADDAADARAAGLDAAELHPTILPGEAA